MPADKPLPVFTVHINVSRQWGDPQQKALDTLLFWHAQIPPEDGLKVEAAIHKALSDLEFGTFARLSERAERALEELGKGQQLTLCDLKPKG